MSVVKGVILGAGIIVGWGLLTSIRLGLQHKALGAGASVFYGPMFITAGAVLTVYGLIVYR